MEKYLNPKMTRQRVSEGVPAPCTKYIIEGAKLSPVAITAMLIRCNGAELYSAMNLATMIGMIASEGLGGVYRGKAPGFGEIKPDAMMVFTPVSDAGDTRAQRAVDGIVSAVYSAALSAKDGDPVPEIKMSTWVLSDVQLWDDRMDLVGEAGRFIFETVISTPVCLRSRLQATAAMIDGIMHGAAGCPSCGPHDPGHFAELVAAMSAHNEKLAEVDFHIRERIFG